MSQKQPAEATGEPVSVSSPPPIPSEITAPFDVTVVEGLITDSLNSSNEIIQDAYCGCPSGFHSQSISLGSPNFPEAKYIPERRKSLVVFAFFISSVLLNQLVLAIISDIISRNPLPDLMHSFFRQSTVARELADSFATAGSASTFIFCCIFHKYRWIIGRRLFFIGTILFLMRAVSICVTHIPSGYEDNAQICAEPSKDADPTYASTLDNFARIFVTMGLQVTDSSNRLFCGDMLFSGHTTTISVCCFFLNFYMPHSLWPAKLIVISSCLIAMVCLVASRAHYTVDVIMGYWISSILFSLYHAYCELPHEIRTKTRPFRRLFIFWTMFEMERKVPAGRLPNKLEWPLPWPKRAARFMENWNDLNKETWEGRLANWLTNHRIKLHM